MWMEEFMRLSLGCTSRRPRLEGIDHLKVSPLKRQRNEEQYFAHRGDFNGLV